MQPQQTENSAGRLWIVLARAHHAIAEYMEHSIAALGIGLTDFAVLEVLLHKGPLSMCEIASKVLVANASMTSAIDRLSERDLVRRNTHPEDRRVRVVELTADGRVLARKLFMQHERDICELMAGVRSADRDNLRAGLKQIGLRAQDLLAQQKSRTATARS